jgi:protein-L-isoaspartate O-methyltransferase
MDRDTELEIVRRAYAKQIMASIGVFDRRIETAFAAVKREDFLGHGPPKRIALRTDFFRPSRWENRVDPRGRLELARASP